MERDDAPGDPLGTHRQAAQPRGERPNRHPDVHGRDGASDTSKHWVIHDGKRNLGPTVRFPALVVRSWLRPTIARLFRPATILKVDSAQWKLGLP